MKKRHIKRFIIFITGVFITLSIVNNISAQNRVEIFVKARYIEENTYHAEIWANVPEGVPEWNIGASCIVVSYNTNALDASDFINRKINITNPDIEERGYSFTQTRAGNDAVSLNFISGNFSGKIEEGAKSLETMSSSKSFHLATLSWHIIDSEANDDLEFNTELSEVSNRFTDLQYDCGNEDCFTFLQPEPQKIGNLSSSISSDLDNALIYISPNPCSDMAVINFFVSGYSFVVIELKDMTGRSIALLCDEHKSSGEYRIEYNVESLAAGTYFVNFSIGDIKGSKKMIIVK